MRLSPIPRSLNRIESPAAPRTGPDHGNGVPGPQAGLAADLPPRGSVPRAAGPETGGTISGGHEDCRSESCRSGAAAGPGAGPGPSRAYGARGAFGPGAPSGRQHGAALLALVLALALGSGIVTIEWLEAAARSSHAARRTEAALAAAREALIGYAVSYPDQHAGRYGPGYLPCPDRTGNGSPNTPCAAGALGRLPWRRLGLHDPRDGSGERLWYALARRFRANGYKHRPLNRETAAELAVDGRSGVAAVILAPGPALPFQDRVGGRFDPAQFLEGGNETPQDGVYVSTGGPSGSPPDRFNDRVAAITRDELMAAAAGRALAAVRAILEEYRDAPWNTGALPWLAPWAGPAPGALPVPGVTAGRLPISSYGSEIETSFRVVGSLAGGSASVSGTVTPAAFGLPAPGPVVPDGRCTWTAAPRIDCTGERRVVIGPGRERVYRFDLHLAGDPVIDPPAPLDIRRRGVRAAEWVAGSRVEVVDLAGGAETGRGEVRFSPGPVQGTLAVHGVAYPLGAGDEAPEWLLENEWRRFLLAAVAPAFTAGGLAGGAPGCGTPGRCLTLVRTGFDGRRGESDSMAIAVLSGEALPHQDRRNPSLGQWFEGENVDPIDLRYEARPASGSFNDRVAAIAPPPGALSP